MFEFLNPLTQLKNTRALAHHATGLMDFFCKYPKWFLLMSGSAVAASAEQIAKTATTYAFQALDNSCVFYEVAIDAKYDAAEIIDRLAAEGLRVIPGVPDIPCQSGGTSCISLTLNQCGIFNPKIARNVGQFLYDQCPTQDTYGFIAGMTIVGIVGAGLLIGGGIAIKCLLPRCKERYRQYKQHQAELQAAEAEPVTSTSAYTRIP